MDFLARGVPRGTTDARTLALRQGVAQANLPTLILVLFQLTGDSKWIGAPYAPR
jgi:4-hydroxyacetophenone monooxygenase